jgi:hypothetical protein
MHQSVVTLRISGDELDPVEITRVLGRPPTHGQRKGETLTGASGRTRIAKFGMWRLEAADRVPGDLNGQIAELLGQLSPSLDVWRAIRAKYKMDLFCGLFMHVTSEGVEFSADTLMALGERGIELGLDIYSPTKKELEEQERAIAEQSGNPTD